ncbi:hypothetical protein BSLG_009565 [Batrachochytrium salamandrivorans]|nr:hypothetical protein BSLG_009565 [Batrachochytrium salamandrivorans]
MPVPKSKYSPLHPTQTSDTLSGYPLITSSRTLFNRGIQGGDGADSPDLCAIPNDLHWECTERILYIYAKLNPASEFRDHFPFGTWIMSQNVLAKFMLCKFIDSASLAAHQVSEHTQETGIGEYEPTVASFASGRS